MVLSRQDTFKYVEELATGNAQVKVDAARALKSLAFNANGEYKEGLIKSGVPRLLMMMINEGSSAASLEQATSCMYSMAREHMESKQALVAAGALRALSTLLNHDSKQCQLNSCATLYAISCAGRDVCKQLAAFRPLQRLTFLVNPGPGRSAQDDQLQLFAALLIVNLLHVKGVTSKEERVSLGTSLQRAYDDATESQVRETIAVGLKRLSSMGSRKSQLKQRLSSLALGGSRKADSGPSSSGVGGGGAPTATSYSSAPPSAPLFFLVFVYERGDQGAWEGAVVQTKKALELQGVRRARLGQLMRCDAWCHGSVEMVCVAEARSRVLLETPSHASGRRGTHHGGVCDRISTRLCSTWGGW